jgi:hypothetical protein
MRAIFETYLHVIENKKMPSCTDLAAGAIKEIHRNW